jgi:hypothetical protein
MFDLIIEKRSTYFKKCKEIAKFMPKINRIIKNMEESVSSLDQATGRSMI